MAGYSLRRGLLGWLLTATALIGIAALVDTWREALHTAQTVSDRVLAGSALAIAERITLDETGGLEVDVPYSALEMLTSTAQDQVFYRVDGASGEYLTGYQELVPVPLGDNDVGFADSHFGEVPIRVASVLRRVSTGDGSIAFTVTVAESMLARNELARSILVRSALRLLGMILGAAIISWIAVTRALRPLNRLGETIAQRSPDDLKVIREETPQEVEGLVRSINSFMTRLETSLAALRNFTGNASHQLRTPLAVVRTQLALLGRSTDPAQARDAADKADAAVARAERVLAQLLVLSRIDASAVDKDFGEVDIAEIGRDLVAEMAPAAARQGIDLGYDGTAPAIVNAEPVLCSEMLRNLLDNAIAYSGTGSVVTLRTGNQPIGSFLEVEDNGIGLSPDRLNDIRQRRRGHTRDQTGQHGGLGLGLAVVHEIAHLFSALVEISPGREGRGLAVRICFDTSGANQKTSNPPKPIFKP